MDGIFTYWILWMAWVCVMFFVPKAVPVRFSLLFHLLAVMVLCRYKLMIYSFSVQLSGLYLFGLMCMWLRKYSLLKTVGIILNCFLLAIAYASFQLFALLDPIWVMMKPVYLQCIFMNYLIFLLVKDWKLRLMVLMVGMIVGDLVYGGLLTYQLLPYVSLSFAWHDVTAMVIITQLLWSFVEYVSKLFYRQTQMHFLLKEKQG